MVRMLVTGATGGIGRTLVPLLDSLGIDVVASGRDTGIGRTLVTRGVEFWPADLSLVDLAPRLVGVDTVIHLAARSSPWGRASDFDLANVRATGRVLDAAASAGVRRFVHASTPAIFADRIDRTGLLAGSRPSVSPVNHYARTKLEAERIVLQDPRMETMVLRPSAVIGPHDRAILPRLLRVLRRGVLPVGNGGAALFHPTDVRDAARAFAAAALGTCNGTANVAGPEAVPVVDMARKLASRLGLSVRVQHVPERVLHATAVAMEGGGRMVGREPPLTRYSVMPLSWSRTFDIEEATSILGWSPIHGADDALEHAVQS